MRLVANRNVIQKIAKALRPALSKEIGGLLFGEHVEGDLFRLVDVSIQTSGGTRAHFVRDPAQHAAALEAFFKKTGYDYARFNYLGEWHSHPKFEVLPSSDDVATMRGIVSDPSVGANFAILMIIRLNRPKHIELSATSFDAGGAMSPVAVAIDGEEELSWMGQIVKALAEAFTSKPKGKRFI